MAERNVKFEAAMRRTPSPAHSGRNGPISRAELAEEVNRWVREHTTAKTAMDEHLVGKIVRGETRWPAAHTRKALCAILGARTETDLGLIKGRNTARRSGQLLTADTCPPSGAVTQLEPGSSSASIPATNIDRILCETSGNTGDVDLMTNVDAVRALAVSTITGRSASDEVVDLIEERVHDHTLSYPSSAPKHALGALVADIGRVQRLAGERQPATVQGRLSAASAVLFTLGADALMKLGDSTRARRWYQTAMMAAGDAGRPELRALVHAQQTMLSYYSGRFDEAVELARNAQQLLSGRPCGPAALAAAAEGRALARLDDHRGAEQAIGKARDLVDKLGSRPPDVAFEFGEERLLLYLSGTLTYMGQHTRAERVQARALELYARRPHVVVDPALITLDQAIGRVAAGCPAEGCALATATLRDLDPEHHRTPLLLNRAREVITVVPAGHRAAAATELRELLAEQYERSR